MSARFIDASIYRDTSHAIRIAIQLERIANYYFFSFNLIFFLNHEPLGDKLYNLYGLIVIKELLQ